MAKKAEHSAKSTGTPTGRPTGTKAPTGRPIGRPKKKSSLDRKEFVRMYESATFPTFLVDRELRIGCPNQAARAFLPPAGLTGGLAPLLPEDLAAECLDRVRRGDHFHLDAPLSSILAGLEFVPVSEDGSGKPTGAAVVVTSLRGRAALGEDTASPASLRSLSQDLRDYAHGILAQLRLLHRGISPEDTRRCNPSLRELNLLAYQLLRLAANFSSYQSELSAPRPHTQVVDFWRELARFLEPSTIAFRGSAVPFSVRLPDPGEAAAHVDCRFGDVELALTNLLRNAFLYTRDGNRVTLTGRNLPAVGDTPARVEVSIRDLGRGIPVELMNSVFLPFLALGEEGGDFPEIRLGLRVSRLLIVSSGGSITMESVSGEGTTVTISFPVSSLPATPSGTMHSESLYRPDPFSTFFVGLCDVVTDLP